MIYYTSDWHINHKNIIKYCDRPFRDISDMNQSLVSMYNNTVTSDDTVYFLGDLGYFSTKRRMHQFINSLNGDKVFLKGDHDKFMDDKYMLIADYVLCHWPLESWYNKTYGVRHLHGHCHGTWKVEANRLDIGIDNYYKLYGSYGLFDSVDVA